MSKSTKQTKRTTATGASSGGKVKKKKWSKGKAKDKANNLVIFDKSLYDRVFKEVSLYKLITPSVLVDRHHINCSLARALLKELLAKGLIVKVAGHHAQMIYTRASSRAEGAKAPKEIPAETGASDASA